MLNLTLRDYKKFSSPTLRILTFKLGGFLFPHLIDSCRDTLVGLGHKVRIVDLKNLGNSIEEQIYNLAREIEGFRPDLVFTFNHAGLAPVLFAKMKLPHICWFVDNPLLWVKKETLLTSLSPYYLPFVFDRYYINWLKKIGFSQVYHLPLATDPGLFRPLSWPAKDKEKYECVLSFVGNSHLLDLTEYNLSPELSADEKVIEEMAKHRAENFGFEVGEMIRSKGFSFIDQAERVRFERLIEDRAMSIHRQRMLHAVAGLGLNIYGDKGWRRSSLSNCYRGEIGYLELCGLYNSSKINLNISAAQLKTTVNQRAFDVPACGGFVLSDFREDLAKFFETGYEAIYFEDENDLRKKAEYYLENPAQREEIAKRARKKVLANHTFRVRMSQMIKMAKEYFKVVSIQVSGISSQA